MANLISSAETLKTREAWKYAELKEVLCSKCVAHEFEFRLGSYVYDLCILDKNMLVEFDGSYHSNHKQRESDKVKDKFGTDNGYKIARVKVPTNAVIPGNLLYSMF